MTASNNNGSAIRLQRENEELRIRLGELEETLSAIRNGEVDAVVVDGHRGQRVYSLQEGHRFFQ
jgi:DNA-binding transcriptional LysR family regulator